MNPNAKAIEVDNKVIALRHPKKETAIQFHRRAGYLHDMLHGDAAQAAHAQAMLHADSLPRQIEDQPS